MPELRLLSPAKLNLFLLITGRRADGYHELQTLFQLLDWGDSLSFQSSNTGQIQLLGGPAGVPDGENLIVRAAEALREKYGVNGGCTIGLEKRIPMGGGLGGGSSNAATTLLALNQLWNLDRSIDELAEIGLSLGADVPLFVRGCSALATGVGEQLQPAEIPERHYLIIHPGVAVNTGKIFAHPELTRDSAAIKIAPPAGECARNDCESVVTALYPEVATAIEWMRPLGNARLTGTGACVFVELENSAQGEALLTSLPKRWTGYVVKGVNHSPTHEQLRQQRETS